MMSYHFVQTSFNHTHGQSVNQITHDNRMHAQLAIAYDARVQMNFAVDDDHKEHHLQTLYRLQIIYIERERVN